MKIDSRGLQLIYQAYVMGKDRKSIEPCPSINSLRRSFDATSTIDEKDTIVDHISHCSSCAQQFEFLRLLSAQEMELAKNLNDIQGCQHRGRFALRRALSYVSPRFEKRYATVFLLVIGVIFVVFVLKYGIGHNDNRGKQTHILALIQPSGQMSGTSPLIFKWEPLPEPAVYVVELHDDTLKQIWESQKITINTTALPESALRRLARNKTYNWAVTAFDQNGLERESGLRSFFLTD
jgi:hypothetical protein